LTGEIDRSLNQHVLLPKDGHRSIQGIPRETECHSRRDGEFFEMQHSIRRQGEGLTFVDDDVSQGSGGTGIKRLG
jgi:hypothetical protein